MKRMGFVFCWVFFALGIPMALILGGFTPHASLIEVGSNLLGGNSEIFLLHLASVLLWIIWLYGICAFLHDLRRLKFDQETPMVSFSFRRWTTMCAAAVWSLLLASHISRSTNGSNPRDTTFDVAKQVIPNAGVDSNELPSPIPLELSASTLLVTGILQLVQNRRASVLRESVPHSKNKLLSRRSQSTLTELQLAAMATNCNGLRQAMVSLIESETPPILASWQPNLTPRVLLQRADPTIGAQLLCCVPIGLIQGEISLLTISRGEAITVILDEGCRARGVLTHLALSIVFETLGSNVNVIVCGFTDTELINAPHLTNVDSREHLIKHVLNAKSSDPTIVCSADLLSNETVNELRALGCGVVSASIEPNGEVALVHTQHGWIIHPIQQFVSLYGISLEESTAVSKLVDEVSRPTTVPVVIEKFVPPPEWKIMVRMLGPVEVMTREGLSVPFEKSKSIELLAWLTTHRSRPSRSAARTALWEVNVQDATFTNVVSDARRSLAKVVPLLEDEEWLPRTLTDALPLNMSVITDGELLDASIHRAAFLDGDTALGELRETLEYVRDLPFSGSNYLWSDSEGITTQLTLSVMTSAVMASELYLKRGDTEGVFWATGRGLKVLPGHEELLALRMRAHALKGDLAAVRAEWNSHQRAIARDVWSGGATSPKLNELCRELLQRSRQDVYSVSEQM